MKKMNFKSFWHNARMLMKEEWSTLIYCTLGTIITSFMLVAMIMPYRFAGSGVSGIALLTNYIWGISPAWVLLVVNVLLLLWGWRELSFRFVVWTSYVTVLTSLSVWFFELFQYPVVDNTLLVAMIAGGIGGIGYGMIFKAGASSGGTDIIAVAAKKRWGFDIGSFSFVINIVILLLSYVVVTLEQLLLGALLLFFESLVIDSVIKSFDRRVQIIIISKANQQIIDFVVSDLDRGATIIPAMGAYSQKPLEALLVVLSQRQTVDLKRFVYSVDPSAFMIFSSAMEVVGEGFKKYGS